MKCGNHPELDSVNTCVSCGAGLCNECDSDSILRQENRPFCYNCIELELKSTIKKYKTIKIWSGIKAILYGSVLLLGLIAFFINLSEINETYKLVDVIFNSLLIWGIAFIPRFFMKKPIERSKRDFLDLIFIFTFPKAGSTSWLVYSFFWLIKAITVFILTAVCLPIVVFQQIMIAIHSNKEESYCINIYNENYSTTP